MAIKPIKKAISDHYKIKVHSLGCDIRNKKPRITPNKKWKVYTLEIYVKNA